MTSEEAKKAEKELNALLNMCNPSPLTKELEDALKMAIKALEQQPQTIVMTKEEFERYLANEDLVVVKRKFLNEALEAQPTDARPWGTKLGTWIERTVIHKDEAKEAIEEWQSARCSVCGKYHTTPYMYYFDEFKYCPNCGAEMSGGGEDEADKEG